MQPAVGADPVEHLFQQPVGLLLGASAHHGEDLPVADAHRGTGCGHAARQRPRDVVEDGVRHLRSVLRVHRAQPVHLQVQRDLVPVRREAAPRANRPLLGQPRRGEQAGQRVPAALAGLDHQAAQPAHLVLGPPRHPDRHRSDLDHVAHLHPLRGVAHRGAVQPRAVGAAKVLDVQVAVGGGPHAGVGPADLVVVDHEAGEGRVSPHHDAVLVRQLAELEVGPPRQHREQVAGRAVLHVAGVGVLALGGGRDRRPVQARGPRGGAPAGGRGGAPRGFRQDHRRLGREPRHLVDRGRGPSEAVPPLAGGHVAPVVQPDVHGVAVHHQQPPGNPDPPLAEVPEHHVPGLEAGQPREHHRAGRGPGRPLEGAVAHLETTVRLTLQVLDGAQPKRVQGGAGVDQRAHRLHHRGRRVVPEVVGIGHRPHEAHQVHPLLEVARGGPDRPGHRVIRRELGVAGHPQDGRHPAVGQQGLEHHAPSVVAHGARHGAAHGLLEAYAQLGPTVVPVAQEQHRGPLHPRADQRPRRREADRALLVRRARRGVGHPGG